MVHWLSNPDDSTNCVFESSCYSDQWSVNMAIPPEFNIECVKSDVYKVDARIISLVQICRTIYELYTTVSNTCSAARSHLPTSTLTI